ncbi:MAG: chromosomal replication initiator protein DnaA [Desulfohalobiaceae bacterium]|nr:chromosomal replication initiator protein DnaA [Desulfohalobiaceae bacterium]
MKLKWDKIKAILAKRLKTGTFQVWIHPLQADIQDKTLFIKAPNEFVVSRIKERLQDVIRESACDVLGYFPALSIQAVAHTENSTGHLFIQPEQQKQQSLPNLDQPAVQQWRFTFDHFLVGHSNNLAYAACNGICSKDFPVDNLFLSSAPGLGKTHLIQSIGHKLSQAFQKNFLNVAYISSEQFAGQMVRALKNKEIEQFKNRYRKNVDLLLMEDVHFFQGKNKMQEELLSLIKALNDKGSHVVFSSSFLPHELEKVDSQLTSHFCSGVLAPIQKPDYDLRLRIIRAKSRQHQLDIPASIQELIASKIKSDIRQVESCLKNLTLKTKFLNETITPDLTWDVLKNYVRNSNTPKIEEIINCVSDAFGLEQTKLGSKSRKKHLVLARNITFYLARKYTDLSLKEIGKHMNRRHSTVLKGITNIEKEVVKDTQTGRELKRIAERLEVGA